LPQFLESLFVYFSELPAELDKIWPADHLRRLFRITSGFEVWQIREIRVTANVKEILYPPLGREAIVVPPHGIEDIFSRHAALACDEILMRVTKYVADVKRAAYRRRRRVNDESLVSRACRIPAMDPRHLPSSAPFALNFLGHVLFRQFDHANGLNPNTNRLKLS